MRKNLLRFALVISIVASLFMTMTITVNAETYGIYTYTIENDEVTITGCNDLESDDIVIPSTIKGYPVTSIGDRAFEFCNHLTNITIPDSVTTIGSYAFSECGSLNNVTIPNSVTSIGDRAFSWCISLTSITLPDGITTIGNGTFVWCGLKNITIPDSVITIGDNAFHGCDLTTITIPNGVTTIGYEAFAFCYLLDSITIPDSVTSIGERVFEDDDLTDVYYGGTEEEWNAIEVGEYNDELADATIHFAEEEPIYAIGDADGDGEISVKDVISIRRFIIGSSSVTINETLADVNKDGKVGVKDIITLRRYISGGYGVEL